MRNPRVLLSLVLIGVLTFGSIGSSHGDKSTEDCDVTVNLTGVGLRRLPYGFLENQFVTRLILDDNQIPADSVVVLAFTPRLSHLSLANNKFTPLNLYPFSRLPILKTLNLNGNCKPETREIIQPTRSPSYYNYDGFYEERQLYESQDYCNLEFNAYSWSLTHLFVENNNIRNLIFTFGQFSALTHLYLSHNPLQINRRTMLGLNRVAPKLTHLYLRDCGIIKFDASALPSLRSLYLDNNNIRSICNDYCTVSSLSLTNVGKLETLSISRNKISTIEINSFGHNRNLITLDLSHNQISEIRGGTFDKLHQLQSLSLESNNCKKLHSEHTFKGLIKLEELFLGGNKVSYIPDQLFGNLTTLKKLMLNSSNIYGVDSEAFSKLSRLEVLSLAGNQLSSIPNGSLPTSGSLITLNLDNNKFTNSKQISLINSPNLLTLSLRSNPFTTLSASWFSNVTKNLTITLGNNCDTESIEIGTNEPPFESPIDVTTEESESPTTAMAYYLGLFFCILVSYLIFINISFRLAE